MKLVFITNNLPPIVDGVGDYTFHLANEFSKKGFEVSIICSEKLEVINYLRNNQFNYEVFPIVKKWDIVGIYAVYKKIKSTQPEYTFLQYVPYAYNHYGAPFLIPFLLFLLKRKFKTFVFFHEVRIKLLFLRKNYIIGVAQKLISQLIYHSADKVATSNYHYSKLISSKSCIPIIRIPSNIFGESFLSRDQLRKINAVDKDDYILLTFGKNIRSPSSIVESLYILSNKTFSQNLNYKLIIMGKIRSDVELTLRNLTKELGLAEKVLLTGYLPSSKIVEYFSLSDLYLSIEPLISDNWTGVSTRSGTLATAFKYELPILGTKGELTDDFFKHGHNIFLIEKDQPSIISKAILEISLNNTLQKNLKKDSLNTKISLDWKTCAVRHMEIIEYAESL